MVLCLSIITIFVSFLAKENKTKKKMKIMSQKPKKKEEESEKRTREKLKKFVIGIRYVHSLCSFFVNSFPTLFIRVCSLYFKVCSVGELQGFLVF